MLATARAQLTEDGFYKKRWTVAECRQMVETGLLEAGKFELIEGEVIFKMGQGRRHIAAITSIIVALSAVFGGKRVQSHAPIGIGELDEFNDPEPDVGVLKRPVGEYLEHEPIPAEDFLLIVEAAETSLKGDTTTKAQIYARHGVREYWVLSLKESRLIVHRNPSESGFELVTSLSADSNVSPLAAPDSTIKVSDLLP